VLVVLDTNVVLAGLRSRRGASFALLSELRRGAYEIALSVPLLLECEDVLLRQSDELGLEPEDIGDVLDFLCSVARHQPIFYLWRPIARDPGDDMVAELAVAAGVDAIVTHNLRDFTGVSSLGLRVMSPQLLLREIGYHP